MKRKYENLILALANFAEDWWLPYEDCIGCLNTSIKGGMIELSELKKDFSEVISIQSFDWHHLAKESQLLIEPEAYTDIEIANYVKCLLSDFLFSENALDSNKIGLLSSDVAKALQNHDTNDCWMFSYALYDELKKSKMYENLEYYNLWKIDFSKYNIEIKSIENKDREIGYLRYSNRSDVKNDVKE